MNGEEEVPIPNWLKNINYIISGLSIIVYIFYTYLLLRIKLKNWDYSLLIKAYLVFISFCQSLYYFFSPDNKTMCKLLGSFDIFLDYVKISLSINILLLNTNDKISMNININNKTIFIINFIFSFLIPLCFGEIVFFYGEIQKIQELFCYPMNETIRYFTYITHILYYCVFFVVSIYIFHFKINKTLNEEAAKEEKRNQDTTDLSIDESVIKANISLLKCSIISYLLIQCVKFFNCVIFLMNFMCGKNHILFLCSYVKGTTFFNVISFLIQNLTIPFFLLAFGLDNINGISLTNRITQNTTMKVLPEFQRLSNAQSVDDTHL